MHGKNGEFTVVLEKLVEDLGQAVAPDRFVTRKPAVPVGDLLEVATTTLELLAHGADRIPRRLAAAPALQDEPPAQDALRQGVPRGVVCLGHAVPPRGRRRRARGLVPRLAPCAGLGRGERGERSRRRRARAAAPARAVGGDLRRLRRRGRRPRPRGRVAVCEQVARRGLGRDDGPGMPSASTREGRSRRSQCETRAGRVETIASSKRRLAGTSRTTTNGSALPTRPSTWPPAAASSSSGIASSGVSAASSVSGPSTGAGRAA
jgi:hypothetical protein